MWKMINLGTHYTIYNFSRNALILAILLKQEYMSMLCCKENVVIMLVSIFQNVYISNCVFVVQDQTRRR